MGIQCSSTQIEGSIWKQRQKSSLSSEVTLGVMPCRIEHECLAEEHFYFVFCPILCRQRLQEHDDALHERVLALYNVKYSKVTHLEVHLTELVAPSYKKRRTDIQVKLRKGVRAFRLYAHRAQRQYATAAELYQRRTR